MKLRLPSSPPSNYLPHEGELLRRILWAREIPAEEAELFLAPRLDQMPDPFGCLKDLEIALDLLKAAHLEQKKICVFGDYDVDGTTSSTLLTEAFKNLGFDVSTYIPHRIEEGYGLSKIAAENLLQKEPGVQLLVTCDCGVSSFEGIDYLKSKGLSVIVTDHHTPAPLRSAADAVINPKQSDCRYPDKNLAGVGVAFLLLCALRRALGRSDFSLRPYLDLVAVGSICDMVPLRGLNRAWVQHGMRVLKEGNRPIWQALTEVAGKALSDLEAEDVGFVIGPRLNATGRLGDPKLGFEALSATTLSEARQKASELEKMNRERRRLQEEQTEQVLKDIDPSRPAQVIWNPDFHLGLVGLIASRVMEKTARPVCVMTRLEDESDVDGGIWKGSLRAPKAFNLAAILQQIEKEQPGIFLSFGGHAAAAGVGLREDNLLRFREAFEKICSSAEDLEVEVAVDLHWRAEDSPRLNREDLERLKPFGMGNEAPRVFVEAFELRLAQVLKEEHLRLEGRLGPQSWKVMQFRSPWTRLAQNKTSGIFLLDFVGELSENKWKGRSQWEFRLLDVVGWGNESEDQKARKRMGSDAIRASSPAG